MRRREKMGDKKDENMGTKLERKVAKTRGDGPF